MAVHPPFLKAEDHAPLPGVVVVVVVMMMMMVMVMVM